MIELLIKNPILTLFIIMDLGLGGLVSVFGQSSPQPEQNILVMPIGNSAVFSLGGLYSRIRIAHTEWPRRTLFSGYISANTLAREVKNFAAELKELIEKDILGPRGRRAREFDACYYCYLPVQRKRDEPYCLEHGVYPPTIRISVDDLRG